MIKVVIADDSAFLRKILKDVLEESKLVDVVGTAKNGKEAMEFVKSLEPDVLILDCEMPVMNGIDALKIIMKECPLPVFMFSAFTSEEANITIKAMEYGAVDFLQKPEQGAHALNEVRDVLIKKLVAIVNKQKKLGQSTKVVEGLEKRSSEIDVALENKKGTIDLIAIGSSTGGIQAATEIIRRLPEKMPPIVWVQHLPESFTNPFAKRLDSLSKITVVEAKDGEPILNDYCYIANGAHQMRVAMKLSKPILRVGDTNKVSGHCPSCDVLFESVSEYFSHNVLGVILTGMGEDGTKGLKMMHDKGAFVLGQNEVSCVVYGMPRAAHRAGAVDLELNIVEIAETIVQLGART